MANEYKVKMQQYNGTDFDIVYPFTIASQIGTPVDVTVENAGEGIIVTAIAGSDTRTVTTDSSGKARIFLPFGTWTISSTAGEVTDSVELVIDTLKTYEVNLVYGALVNVAVSGAPSGTTVTATLGSTIKTTTTDASGNASFNLSPLGTWTIAVTSTAWSGSQTLNVNAYTTYSVTFVYGLFDELDKNTWAVIKSVSDANQGSNYWAVGDAKSVVLNGTAAGKSFNKTLWVYIIGFNHNSAREGNGIAFQGFKTAQTSGIDVCLIGQKYGTSISSDTGFIMNTSDTNTGGWNGSFAYKTQMPAIKAILPSDLQAVIKSTTLWTDNTGGGSDTASYVTSNSNEVYYLAEFEVWGSRSSANSAEQNYQAQYTYYSSGNSKIKYRDDSTSSAARWWCRSPSAYDSSNFCIVYTNGGAYYTDASNAYGAAPAFKV